METIERASDTTRSTRSTVLLGALPAADHPATPTAARTVLLTGFEAYGNTPVNPAESVVRALDHTAIDDATVAGIVVPNTFFECIDVVAAAIVEEDPEVVLMMGEFGGRSMITVERFAENFNDSTRYDLVDNEGAADARGGCTR